MNRRDPKGAALADPDAVYIATRVIDALLREDVRGCVSQGRLVQEAAIAAGMTLPEGHAWLAIEHLGQGRLWIPVAPERFMQTWRLSRLPLLSERGGQVEALFCIGEILARFAEGCDADTAARFAEFAVESDVALAHRRAAESARRDWFASSPRAADAAETGEWHDRMQHHDRLASYLDHPLYPTARAKLGFEVEDLRHYAPEFAPSFELNWLAVPRALHHPRGDGLPPGWPAFADVGLPASLEADHALMPVHPFLWRNGLDVMLEGAGLAGRVTRAPRTHLRVTPTLSVRSLVVLDAPEWHIKLPLTIRTLGAKNIRTIKPSTIGDGQRVQDLLAAVLDAEPALRERVLLTREDTGAHVGGHNFLGMIVRRYPAQALRGSTPVPVAGLLAETPDGRCVSQSLADRFHGGDLGAFFDAYLDLTLRLHLTLWVRYGIALESNQQNSVVVLSEAAPRLRLLLKDNDAARLHRAKLAQVSPALAARLDALEDPRLLVPDELPLAQMFTTITLQLNIAVLAEGLAAKVPGFDRAGAYAAVRDRVAAILDDLAASGGDVELARRTLLRDDRLCLKYLLTAATLLDKATTGAADVNKFYGQTAPNFLKFPA
ncbi:IucA/IucC family protein [Roseateles sp.]|uniref:IucA/IucC family protein n=1 Tax=Roseateles sp. TaxID=1971397 RepID=UPI0031CDD825